MPEYDRFCAQRTLCIRTGRHAICMLPSIAVHGRWEKEGAHGWSYADCLPYFQKAQVRRTLPLPLLCSRI